MTNYTFQSLFDFARATSGTFVGSNGLIQTTPASVNLLTFTQQFDNAAWITTAGLVTANVATAPDGTSTMDAAANDIGVVRQVYQQVTAAVASIYTASVYLKAGTASSAAFTLRDATLGANLSITGVIVEGPGTLTATGSSSITVSGLSETEFTRVSVTLSSAAVAGNLLRFSIYPESISSGGSTGKNVLIWGAQLEVGSTATTYTRNNGGRFPPRFDYDPATLAPKGILIEEQRVNLLTYSNDLSTGWTRGSAATWVPNAAAAPDGTTTALSGVGISGISINSTAGAIYRTAISVSGNTTYTATIYVRTQSGTAANVVLRLLEIGGKNNTSAAFTLGTTWTRISYTITTDAGATALVFLVGTSTGTADLFIWGAQLEAGAFATSYIPTVASQVTRARDVCGIVAPNFAPWYNQSEGTFVVSYDVGSTASALPKTTAVVHDGTTSNRIYGYLNVGGPPVVLVTTGGAVQASLVAASVSADTVNQMAFAYRDNDVALSSNGGAVLTDTSATMPTVDQLSIGGFTPTAAFLNGHIRSVRYYPVRLADFQLQALTA